MMELSSSTLELVPPSYANSPNLHVRGVTPQLNAYTYASKRSPSVISGISSIPLQLFSEGNRLTSKEKTFLEAAEKGDKATILRCVTPPDPVNVNVTNLLGRSALQMAVDNENIEIVEILLAQPNVQIGDALLYAIREGVYKMVEMMVNHPSISREMLGGEWSKMTKGPMEESSDYSPDISPVILAAHCNQFEILQLLLTRGATISRPHTVTCSCETCTAKQHEDSLRHSLHRINTYKSLASPAWISLTSSDPILTAFKLSWELEHLAMRENEFKDVYQELSGQCKTYAVDLLEQCRSSEEVIAVLNRENDPEDEYAEDDVMAGKITLSRLKLALKYEQKQFVAHAHTQQLLTSIWYEGLPGWRKHNGFVKLLICLGVIVLLPFMAMYYLFFPRTKVGQLLRTPFMKFMNHSISFGFFLLLLVLASTVRLPPQNDSTTENYEGSPRGREPNAIEILIAFWVFGFIWGECKQLWEEGLKAYIRQWWNWLDFIMLSLYLCTISLRFAAWWLRGSGKYPELQNSEQQRINWPVDDPTLISEGVFAVANVFSFFRIIYLFQANPYLGPLQISLGCMLIDIAKFLFIFFLVLLSFACGLNQLYWYHESSIQNPDQTCESSPTVFLSLTDTCVTLFWAVFGMVKRDMTQLAHNLAFTESIGELLLLCWSMASIIVLINMLIAMMSQSYQHIQDHADREWKFARTKLWMSYFDEGSTLPPPFNLIISPKSIAYFFKAIRRIMCGKCAKTKSKPQRQSLEGSIKKTHQSNDGMIGPNLQKNTKYQDVMKRLVSRYIHQRKAEQKQDGVNEDDLNEIKQDISSLRYELREDRKKEQMRGTSQIENVKEEIICELRGIAPTPDGTPVTATPPPALPISAALSQSRISKTDLQLLREDIIDAVRSEVKAEVLDALRDALHSPGCKSGAQNFVPPSGELYHTHLYTQL
ncbi:transient-receptor-potential-like protein isoform X2 [Ptychodera flava]|uniref:transient-receptor-potential-like protein isoform X2 n=1 Tax=Ptychodera flava TaxID=63121 RepID=UPI00396A5D31